MSNACAHKLLTEADYLEFEESAVSRHELVGGEAHGMAGASERHNRISGNIFFHLRAATRGKTCRAFMADMKLRLAQGTLFYYPDVMLVCDPADDHPQFKQAPCLVAEVLSPATAKVDQREKLQSDQAIPGLRYYLLVDSERLWVKVYFLDESGTWFDQVINAEFQC